MQINTKITIDFENIKISQRKFLFDFKKKKNKTNKWNEIQTIINKKQ